VKVKILDQRHSSYDGTVLQRQRALFEGGRTWHALASEWFPKRAVEPSDVREERLGLAFYNNYTGNILASLASMLFAEAPSITGIDGDFYASLQENADRLGSTWAEFWRERFIDAASQRSAWVWVNLPRRPQPAEGEQPAQSTSMADEIKAGLLDAFLVGVSADQVIDWGEDESGRLSWVMIRDVVSRRAGVDQPRVSVHRWTYLSATEIKRWEWASTPQKREPSENDVAEQTLAAAHNMPRLPLVRLELPHLLWPMGRLEDPAVALLRAENDQHWAIHQAANELLVLTSKFGDEKRPTLGHGHYLALERDSDGEDTAQFVGPSGIAFEAMQTQVERLRDDLHRVVGQMAQAASSNAARARMSGESKQADWRAAEVMLSAFAGIVLDAMREVLKLIVDLRKDGSSELQVGGLDGWHQEDLMAWLEAVNLATDARQYSPTYCKVVARKQAERTLADAATPEEMERIHSEIEKANVETGPLFAASDVTGLEPEDDDAG